MRTTIRNATLMSLAMTTAAYASKGAESGGGSLMMWIFFSFVGLIIVMQLIPGLALFVGMAKGIFSTFSKKEELAAKLESSD